MRLERVTEVARGGYLAPKISPAGDRLLATGPRYRGIYSIERATGAATELAGDAGAGLKARFLDEDRVAFVARRAGAERSIVIGRDGTLRSARPGELPEPVAVARADRIYALDAGGRYRPVASGDRFFAPVTSPDRRWVAFQGLASGIYLYRIDSGELIHVGAGTAPAFSPGSDRLVFERTEDDGHAIVGSDLYLYDLERRRLARLTQTDAVIERRPSLGPDGTVAFDDDRGGLYLAHIAGGR